MILEVRVFEISCPMILQSTICQHRRKMCFCHEGSVTSDWVLPDPVFLPKKIEKTCP